MMRIEVAKKFAEDVGRKFPEVSSVILYGSVARGEDTEDSDIDLLVLTRKRAKIDRKLNDIVADYILETSELPMPIVHTERDFNERESHFFTEIKKHGKKIYARD